MSPRQQHYLEAYGLLLSAVLLWWHFQQDRAPVGTTVLAKPAAELKGEQKQDITPPKVQAYKPAVKKKLDLPPTVQDDQNKYVLDSVKLPNDTHPHTVTTVIDAQTGEVQTYDRRDPLPWLAAEQIGEVRIDYGIKNGMAQVWRITAREDLVQVKALHAGMHATIDNDGAWFAGGGVGWRW